MKLERIGFQNIKTDDKNLSSIDYGTQENRDICEEHEWDNTRMSIFKNDRNWAGWRCGRYTEYDGYENQLSWLWENFELHFWVLSEK